MGQLYQEKGELAGRTEHHCGQMRMGRAQKAPWKGLCWMVKFGHEGKRGKEVWCLYREGES